MNVTAGNLPALRSAYTAALKQQQTCRAELDTATLEMNQRAETADKLANKINRWVAVRNKMPYVGMGSFLVGMGLVQGGVVTMNPVLMGCGLAGFVVCGACIVGIETWKVKGPRMRAEHDQLYARFNSSLSVVQSKTSALSSSTSALKAAEAALRKEEASIDELQRMLKPPAPNGISERTDAVVVGGIRLPKRPNQDKKSLF